MKEKSTKEMYDNTFGEGAYDKLEPNYRLKLIEFATVCRYDGGIMAFDIVKKREENLKPIQKS